ncbi:precorrin-6A/cobalt-precorrin-6A reductase [Aliiroseovarius crassostreae]|uniref:precorrin-6A/cobalt-precorrin-6A reductase n=1 Tax=Aliiroseovarius crassostreae TaxID=154981 RepID=UPI003C7AB640
MTARRILLLAGTAEARALAAALQDAGHQVTASLAGVTKHPKPLGVPTRHGGFGGTAAQAAYLAEQGFDGVVDATHPFAATIPHRTAQICAEMGVSYLRYLRPQWDKRPDEAWHDVSGVSELGQVIPDTARVFLATGVQSRPMAEALPGRVLYCRKVDEGPDPFPLSGGWITGRPPFTVGGEQELFARLGVGWLVAKNAGGPARAKLEAARALGISVAMIARPAGQDAPTVHRLDDALRWVAAL